MNSVIMKTRQTSVKAYIRKVELPQRQFIQPAGNKSLVLDKDIIQEVVKEINRIMK